MSASRDSGVPTGAPETMSVSKNTVQTDQTAQADGKITEYERNSGAPSGGTGCSGDAGTASRTGKIKQPYFRSHRTTLILALVLVLTSAASLFVGVLDVSVPGLLSFDPEQWRVFLVSRIPRLLAILCTGMGMSVAGLIMQKLCMNKFISPTTGATIQSAQFGVLLAMIFTPSLGLVGRSLFAFVAAALGTWLFVWFIQKVRFKDVIMVPLVGIMFGYVITGVTSFIAFFFELNQALSTWLVGHFSLVVQGRYELVLITLPLLVLAFVFANHFNIVGMGRDFSKNLGVPYGLVLTAGLTICAFITASVVCTVGSISYIGLIVPNIVAMFKGDRIRGTLVDTALFGAEFVLVCDLVARVIITPFELPIEMVVGVVGSIVFIALLIYRLNHGTKSVRTRKASAHTNTRSAAVSCKGEV